MRRFRNTPQPQEAQQRPEHQLALANIHILVWISFEIDHSAPRRIDRARQLQLLRASFWSQHPQISSYGARGLPHAQRISKKSEFGLCRNPERTYDQGRSIKGNHANAHAQRHHADQLAAPSARSPTSPTRSAPCTGAFQPVVKLRIFVAVRVQGCRVPHDPYIHMTRVPLVQRRSQKSTRRARRSPGHPPKSSATRPRIPRLPVCCESD